MLDGSTVISGDLIRGHAGGRLNLLPDSKLADRDAAFASLKAVLDAHPGIDAVLVGDGWPMFRGGGEALRDLLAA